MKALKKALVALLGAVLGCCFFAGCLSTKLSVTYVVDGETYRVQEYEMDTKISLPTAPTKEGYTFIGWYTDEALTTPYAEGTITAGLTLYAKFSVSSVYIVVNTAGGAKIDPIEVVPGGDYTVPEAVKEGHTFLGYTYIDENGEEQDFPLTGKYPSSVAIRITAKYEVNKYKVTFVGAGTSEQDVAYGSVAIAPSAEKAGFEFKGWYTTAIEEEQTDDTKFDLTTAITGDITLYAKYEAKTFTITVNGAQVDYENPTVKYGETYTLATPELDQFDFVKFTMDGKDFPATGTYTWTTDIVVDAVWAGDGKFVSFYDGVTELSSLRIVAEYDTAMTAIRLPNVPVKAGYTTDNKWYTDAACTQEFVAEGTITADIRLYAKYTANEYTVTFVVWDSASKTMKNVNVPVTYGQTIANVPAHAERDAYDFKGYFYGETLFDITKAYTYTTNIIVEEKWELRADASLFEEYNSTGKYFKEREDYDSEWTYVYLVGTTYTYSDTTQLSMVTGNGSIFADVAGNVMTVKSAGTFVVQVNNNGTIYNQTIKTVEAVRSFSLGGTGYDTAWGLNEAGTDYKRNATDVWDKKVTISAGEAMKVGKTNFIPEISINGKVTTFDVANVNVSVSVNGNETSDYAVANGAINFGNSLVGKNVAVSLSPKYNIQNFEAVYNVMVNEAVNVYTNVEMKAAFADTNVTEINVLRNITAELSDDQMDTFTWEGHTYKAPINARDKEGNHIGGTGVYTRKAGSLSVNGNYFTVDGSKLPLVDGRLIDSYENGYPGHMTQALVLQDVNFSIFNFGDRLTAGYDNYVVENINVIGNGQMDASAKAGYQINNTDVLIYSGACIGIQVGSGTLNMNNVTSRMGAFAANAYGNSPILTKDGSSYTHAVKMIATDCKFEKSWANNIFAGGFASITLNGCYIGTSNGAAIHFDALTTPANIPNGKTVNVDCELNMDTATDIQNWVVGSEAWFNAYGAGAAVSLIRTMVEDYVQQFSGGQFNTEKEVYEGGAKTITKNNMVNFAVLMKTVGEPSEWVNDNVGYGTLNLGFDTLDLEYLAKYVEELTQQAMAGQIAPEQVEQLAGLYGYTHVMADKYAKFYYDASALGFGYIVGLVGIENNG